MYRFSQKRGIALQRIRDVESGQYVDQWITLEEVSLTIPDGRIITVPVGFVYDKASVPRIAWWWLPRDDRYVIDAALFHDYLYVTQKIEGEWIQRIEADQIFYGLMRQAGMRWTKAQLAYRAVRFGGWTFFNSRAKRIGNVNYVDSKEDDGLYS